MTSDEIKTLKILQASNSGTSGRTHEDNHWTQDEKDTVGRVQTQFRMDFTDWSKIVGSFYSILEDHLDKEYKKEKIKEIMK